MTAEQTPEEIAEAQAAKDRDLLAKMNQIVSVKPIRPNRAMRRLALRHSKRSWTWPLTPRARRERRALARADIFIRRNPVDV